MSQDTKAIGWGMIGCGNVTETKSGPGFQKARNSRLVAVMRRDTERAREYASRHGVPRWYDDAKALVEDSEVDAVYVATPPSSHREFTLLAADRFGFDPSGNYDFIDLDATTFQERFYRAVAP